MSAFLRFSVPEFISAGLFLNADDFARVDID